jgi:hypothetical protein
VTAPDVTPERFLAFRGVVGLGRIATEGDRSDADMLRKRASDPDWRIREAAMQIALDRG